MTLFPKSKRFPPQKASEVPSPGRYNPLLHDPSQDPWRKGPLEIFKAPRNKETDPGPDTFGLYNPDQPYDNIHGSRPRPRALSTLGTPSKHQKELIRLETKLSERDSNITHLTETLHKSEQATKEIRNALNRSETDNNSLRSEVERLKKQLHGVAGLHAKVIELETEHDKSKKRRDKEISSLKSELRLAEDRASQYLTDKTNLQGNLERLQSSFENAEQLRQSTSRKSNQELIKYLEQVSQERHTNQRTLQLTKSLSLLADVHTKKVLADRASQVTGLVSLVHQAESREDLLYEVFDSLLETSDMQIQQLIEIQMDSCCEREHLERNFAEFREESKSMGEILDHQLHGKELECQLAHQQTSQLQNELSEATKVCSSLQKALIDSSEAYRELASGCSSIIEKSRVETDKCNLKITELSTSIQTLESQIVQLNAEIRGSHEEHSLASEAWYQKQSELQSSIKKLENDIREEKAKRSKLSGELMLTKQAEAALRGELEHAQNLNTQLEEVEQENEQLRKINDLILRQSSLNAAEAEKVEKLNNELVSQRNPAQKVKILDRMRREIKEERENTAKLENQLWTANSAIKCLQDELSAYQSVSHPTSAPTAHSSTIHNGMGIARVTRAPRAPLSDVMKAFNAQADSRDQDKVDKAQVIRPTPKITTRAKGRHQPSNFATPPDFIQETVAEPLPAPAHEDKQPRSSRLPINSNHHKLLKKKDESKKDRLMMAINKNPVDHLKNNNNAGEVSLGAIKMQGLMTLEELR